MKQRMSAGMTLVLGVVVLTLVSSSARADATTTAESPASAPNETLQLAKQHFTAGKDAYNAGKYAVSIREFKAAEAIRPSPILSYNIGLANDKLGKRRLALQYYQSYINALPDAPNRAEVDERIAKLQAQPQAGGDGNRTTVSGDAPPPPTYPPYAGGDPYSTAAPAGGAPPPAAKKSLWWVWMLVGIGGALVLTVIIVVSVSYNGATTATAAAPAKLDHPFDRVVNLPVDNASRASAPTVPVLTLHF